MAESPSTVRLPDTRQSPATHFTDHGCAPSSLAYIERGGFLSKCNSIARLEFFKIMYIGIRPCLKYILHFTRRGIFRLLYDDAVFRDLQLGRVASHRRKFLAGCNAPIGCCSVSRKPDESVKAPQGQLGGTF